MEEDKYPSLPSNYVSLVQLQERWLKEQQRKQREKEEEERKQREKEEQERKREEDQRNRSRSRKQNEERSVSNSVSISSRNFRRNSQIRTARDPARDRRAVELSKPNSEESQGDAVVVPDDQKKDELKKKKRNKRRSNTKPKIEENGTLAGGTSHLSPGDEQVEKLRVVVIEREGEKEGIGSEFRRRPKVEENGTLASTVKLSPEDKQKEKLQVVVIEREGEKEGIGSEFRRKPKVEENGTLARGTVKLSPEDKQKEKLQVVVIDREGGKEGIRRQFWRNGDYRRVNGKVSTQRVPVDETTVLVRSFEDMPLNGGKYGNLGSTAQMNGGRWKFGQGSARFDHQKMWKQRDCNLVWVKKGERIDNDVVGTPSSGLLVKAGKYKKQLPGQSMQN